MTAKKFTENIIFNTRWFLNLFYLMIIMALGYYGMRSVEWFVHEISLGETDPMLFIVEVLDIAMIANLAKMTLTGSYNSFVTKSHGYPNENVSSGLLKVKMATSLINIASIHLLKKYVGNPMNWEELAKLLSIYVAFIVGACSQAFINWLHEKQELEEKKYEQQEHKANIAKAILDADKTISQANDTLSMYDKLRRNGWVQTGASQEGKGAHLQGEDAWNLRTNSERE